MNAHVGRTGPATARVFWVGLAVALAANWLVATLPEGFAPGDLARIAHAESDESSAGKKKPRKVPNMQEATYRRLGEIQALIEEQKSAEALPMLHQMLESKRRYNNNERASIHKLIAYIYFDQENYPETIRHFEQVIAQVPDITEGLENDTLSVLAKLYFQEAVEYGDSDPAKAEQLIDKALRTIRDWMTKVDEVGAEPHHFIAQVYYQKDDKPKSIEHMEKAIELAQKKKGKVKEQWWQLLQALYSDDDQWRRVAEIGEVLVKDYPKRTNWVVLASAYGQIDEPEKQLWTMEAAHVGGYLERELDFYQYAGLLLQNEMPNRASKYLRQSLDAEQVERTLKNLRLLGQAYHVAREVDEAIPVFEEAGALAEDGEPFSRLAALHLQRYENEKCRDAADKALEKGGLRNPLSTKVTLGTCLFEMRKLSDAREVFEAIRNEARKSEDTRFEEGFARHWLRYIENERRRLEALASLSR